MKSKGHPALMTAYNREYDFTYEYREVRRGESATGLAASSGQKTQPVSVLAGILILILHSNLILPTYGTNGLF